MADKGTEETPAEWTPPDAVGADLEADARAFSVAFAVQSSRFTASVRRDWVFMLNLSWPLNLTREEAEGRAAFYAETLDGFPDYLFTKATLADAARQMKWFPSVHELALWLDGRLNADTVRAKRALHLLDKADADRRKGKRQSDKHEEKRWSKDNPKHARPEKTHAVKLAEIRAGKRKYGFGPETDVRGQRPDEPDEAYRATCMDIIRRNMAEAAPFRNSDERRAQNRPFWKR